MSRKKPFDRRPSKDAKPYPQRAKTDQFVDSRPKSYPKTEISGIQPTRRDKIIKDKISGRLTFLLEVPFDFYFRIGSGEEQIIVSDSLIQAVLLDKDKNQVASQLDLTEISKHSSVDSQLVIPGSTLKGATRFRVEESFKAGTKVNACYVVRSQGPPTQKSWRHVKAYGSNQPRFNCRDTRSPCIVCNMFGMMGMRAKIFFSDALLIEGSADEINLQVKTGKTSREEVIKPNAKFRGTLYFENLTRDELGLLFFALNLDINKPVIMGHHKYAIQNSEGQKVKFGHINFKIEQIVTFEGLSEKKVTIISDFIEEMVSFMQKVHGNYIERLKDWAILPC